MGIVDTHSHIYEPEFAGDIEQVIARAKDAGIEKIFLPNINIGSVGPMLSLCRMHPGYLFPMMGLHPTDITADYEGQLLQMESHLSKEAHPFIAVGEVGLDYYWDKTFYHEQQDAFRTQIEWAIRYGLPLMIHTRSAHRELCDIMNGYRDAHLRGVFHCFNGSEEEAMELLSFEGFVLGIGGVVTYKKSALPSVLSLVPLTRIVIETDSPYLAPTPHRGKRNESAFATEIAAKLAQIYNIAPDAVAKATNENVKRIFGSV